MGHLEVSHTTIKNYLVPPPSLHLGGLLALHLEGVGPVGLAQRLVEEGKHGVEGVWVCEIKVLVKENTWNVQFNCWGRRSWFQK